MIKTFIVAILIVMFMPTANAFDGVAPMKISKDGIVHIEGFQYKNNKIFVVKSEFTAADLFSHLYSTIQEIPRKRVWLEIYVAVGNRIVLCKIIVAEIIPAQPEAWKFNDFDKSNFK
jgi:hypothetical protein